MNCLLKVDEHGYSLTCTSAACHALQDRSQAKIAALSCRISVLEQQLEDIIVNQQQQQLSVTCLHDGDDNVSIPDSICLQCLTRKPCCRKETARCRKCSFPLKFANNIHYK